MPDIVIVALFGFIGGLVPSVSIALKARADARVALKKSDAEIHLMAKKSELDTLRVIIDELEEDVERRKKVREEDKERYERRLSEMEGKLNLLTGERQKMKLEIQKLTRYIDTLIEVMKLHNIPVPPRVDTGPLGDL